MKTIRVSIGFLAMVLQGQFNTSFAQKAEYINVGNNDTVIITNSWHIYDSLGDMYMANGDTALALYNYRKAMQVSSPNEYKKPSYQKIKRHYEKSASSFYLPEY